MASPPRPRLRVHGLRVRGAQLSCEVEAQGRAEAVRGLRLAARSRDGREPVVLADARGTVSAGKPHRLTADLSVLEPPADGEEIVDVAIEADLDDGTVLRRSLPMPSWRERRRVRDGRFRHGGRTTLVLPYFSAGKRPQLVLRLETRPTHDQAHLDRLLRMAWLLAPVRWVRGAWLVGEQPHKAQDNGYHLFRWLRAHQPRRRAYYVIAADSPDRVRVEPRGTVVVHGSRQHQWLTLTASRFLATHHAEYLFASRSRRMRRHARGVRIALRHGVFAMKDMSPLYGRPSRDYRTDDIIASSPTERAIIEQDLHYRPRQVHVTGMPRVDALLTDPPQAEPLLLVMPTWRDWLQHDEAFLASDFLARWQAILRDERLRAAAGAKGLRIAILLHPNMRRHTASFQLEGIELLHPGDVEVQDLLRRCSLLLTDYSSVGFDAAFLDRPVVYYQFDRTRFAPHGFVDPETMMPGPTLATHAAVVDEVCARIADDLRMRDDMRQRTDRFLTHRDGGNCARVAALAAKRRPPWFPLVRASRGVAAGALWQRWRAHRSYRPTMRLLYALARLLPRTDVIVFEADTGHGFGDSPRALYEELARRHDQSGRLVWSVRSGRRLPDPAIVRIVRGSPRWFWTLGRARAWITNQNLPHDLRPGRGTTYVQTWHGTPLKRMQHDVTVTHDPAYLERVSAATREWDVLLSPSSYATDAFRSAFRYDGAVIEQGAPRNDILVRGARDGIIRARLRERWSLGERPVVLYAPTFRDGRTRDPLPLDVTELVAMLPDDHVVLVRPHPLVKSPATPAELADRIIDVRQHHDSHELLLLADALVTDYSSLLFDAAVLALPTVLHTPDLEDYRDSVRGFYLDPEHDRPGPLVRTVEEVADALRDLGALADETAPMSRAFAERFCPHDDGHVAERVVDDLLKQRLLDRSI